MSALDTAIGDLGTILGFDPAALANRDHVAVSIEGAGTLHAERQDETLLLYLSRPIPVGADRPALYRDALRAVHFEHRLPARVQCALHDNALIFLARFDAHELDMPAIEQGLDLLIDLHDGVAA